MMIRVGIVTISDRSSQNLRADLSGPALVDRINKVGWEVVQTRIIPDEVDVIRETLVDFCDSFTLDLVLTTGGTGFAPRDVTPEATVLVIQKACPGLVEAMRMNSLRITPHAMLSRAIAGIRNKTLIINLPGSPKGAVENLEVVLPVLEHAIELIQDNSMGDNHNFTNLPS